MTDTPLAPISESGEPVPISPPVTSDMVQKLSAEAIGTAVLVLFGCGAAVFGFEVLNAGGRGPAASTVTTVALAFGFTILLLIYSFGRISGGHFNPAVSVGAAMSGRMTWLEAGYYAAAQVVGGIVGAIVLWIIAHGFSGFSSTADGLGANHFGGPSGPAWWSAFLIELVLTFVFVFVILAVTDKRNVEFHMLAPLAIGLTLAVIHFVAIPVTGTSVNPARSIGPALFSGSGALKDLWLFIVAPLIGGALAGVAHPALFGRAEPALPGSGLDFALKDGKPAWRAQHPQGGYAAQAGQQAAPTWQQPVAPAAEGELPVYEQDGWRWDYASQSWKPIDQPAAPAAPSAPTTPGAPGAGTPGAGATGAPGDSGLDSSAIEETTRIVPPAE